VGILEREEYIGRIEKGFDLFDYHFSRKWLQQADITVRCINQLFEQQKIKKATSDEMALILDEYFKRWCTAGLGNVTLLQFELFFEKTLAALVVLNP